MTGMTDEDEFPRVIHYVVKSGAFAGGPLDGGSFILQLPNFDSMVTIETTVTVDPTGEGEEPRPERHQYAWNPQPDPASLEAGFEYRGRL